MNILKLYYRIAFSKKMTIGLYLIIFLTVFILFSTFAAETNLPQSYEGVKAKIALQDEDHSEASKALCTYLTKTATIKEVGTSDSDQKDALFYAEVDLVVTIPKGFAKDYMAGEKELLQIQQRPDSANGAMLQQKMDSYLQNIRAYQKVDPKLNFQEAGQLVEQDKDVKSVVSINGEKPADINIIVRGMYFNFFSYVVLAIIIMVVGMTMHSIHRSEIMKRNIVSPMSSTTFNISLIAANFLFAFTIWVVLMLAVCVISKTSIFNLSSYLLMGNSFLFMLVCVTMAFLFSALLTNRRHAEDALNGITNVVALGFSFLGGAFVPQSIMPESIFVVSRFLPSYWYVKLTDMLTAQPNVSGDVWVQVGQTYGILILFGIAFLVMGLVIMKKQRSQDEIVATSSEG